MKRLMITAIAMSLMFTACSSTAFSIVKPEVTYASSVSATQDQFEAEGPFAGMPSHEDYIAWQEAESARKAEAVRNLKARLVAIDNTRKMAQAIKVLKSTVGKTPYVFSGSTPRGWDCSGLVLWTYEQVGVELYHSASVQLRSGHIVNNPLPGDIVAYVYTRSSRYSGHVGIYLGDGKVIHSQKPGTRTRIESSEHGVVNQGGLKTVYVRIIPMLPASEMPKKPEGPNDLDPLPAEARGVN